MKNPDPTLTIMSHDGVDFAWCRQGSGPPLVIIGSATYYPRAFSVELREHFELIFVDSRHFMSSYQPEDKELESLTLETFADDLEALRTHLKIEKWAVVGHSVHAQIALAYGAKYPQQTTHLILAAAVPYSFAELGELQGSFWKEDASKERKTQHEANRVAIQSTLDAASASRRFAVDYVGNAALFWADFNYDAAPLWEGVETGPAFARLSDLLPTKAQAKAIIKSIEVPTLVILGRLDYAVPYAAWDGFEAAEADLTWRLFEEASHNPQTETPEHFDRELLSWFKR
ncbi:alpha/beta hydrolase [Myxococcota bacterium]|nr:alpha/beta hydrolase [Myxococcota bacterium]